MNLLQIFPAKRRAFWMQTAECEEQLQEIRLRINRPVVLLLCGKEKFLDESGAIVDKPKGAYCADKEELEAVLNHICRYSLYAYADELKQGFITTSGGHRIGLAGQVVLENDGSVRTMRNISYLNIRVAHQIKGAADGVLPQLYYGQELKNTLIISPPGCGKTTLLRDLIRQISDGNPWGEGRSVGVVDERSELAGACMGQPQNDIGMRTDVLDACPKALGMLLLLRSMSPQVIAVDEIGGREDILALHMAASCGSRILATVHGDGLTDAMHRLGLTQERLLELFDCFLVLTKKEGIPTIKKIYGREEAYAEMLGSSNDYDRLPWSGAVVSLPVFAAT